MSWWPSVALSLHRSDYALFCHMSLGGVSQSVRRRSCLLRPDRWSYFLLAARRRRWWIAVIVISSKGMFQPPLSHCNTRCSLAKPMLYGVELNPRDIIDLNKISTLPNNGVCAASHSILVHKCFESKKSELSIYMD